MKTINTQLLFQDFSTRVWFLVFESRDPWLIFENCRLRNSLNPIRSISLKKKSSSSEAAPRGESRTVVDWICSWSYSMISSMYWPLTRGFLRAEHKLAASQLPPYWTTFISIPMRANTELYHHNDGVLPLRRYNIIYGQRQRTIRLRRCRVAAGQQNENTCRTVIVVHQAHSIVKGRTSRDHVTHTQHEEEVSRYWSWPRLLHAQLWCNEIHSVAIHFIQLPKMCQTYMLYSDLQRWLQRLTHIWGS